MEKLRNGLHPTVKRQERFQGTGRTTPLMDLSFGRLSQIKLPRDFPTQDSTVAEVKAYILGQNHAVRGKK